MGVCVFYELASVGVDGYWGYGWCLRELAYRHGRDTIGGAWFPGCFSASVLVLVGSRYVTICSWGWEV